MLRQLCKSLSCAPGLPARGLARTMSTRQPTSVEAGIADPAAYCKDLVRKRDYESYLIGSSYPRHFQGAFFALRAFYVELASVQDSVSNSMIGKMRIQFWRDAIKNIADGRPPQHPIALALHDASQKANLPAYHLRRIIDARDAELHTPTHLTVESLTAHAESTSSTFLYLLLSLLNLSSSSTFSHAASHLGVAQSIHVLLRALPYHASKGRMVIPAEITARHGVRQEDVLRTGGNAEGISDAVFEFATVANDNLLTAREMFKEAGGDGGKVPRVAMPVFLYGIPTRDYLGRLEAVNFDAFQPSLQLRDWKLPWRLWRGYYQLDF
ncbi:isoprenoid synthase domain-containing protein [Trametes meyenii]|nr:isoprenoid synthase domain-containing protein [Trametes meyenii]